jgi:hypothetical protein
MDYIRQIFFADNKSQGKRKMKLDVQTDALCIDASGASVACSENRRWKFNGVTFFTMNIPGELA